MMALVMQWKYQGSSAINIGLIAGRREQRIDPLEFGALGFGRILVHSRSSVAQMHHALQIAAFVGMHCNQSEFRNSKLHATRIVAGRYQPCRRSL